MPAEESEDAHKEELPLGQGPLPPDPVDAGETPDAPQAPAPRPSADSDLFAGPQAPEGQDEGEIHEELSERQVFIGDDDFYESLKQYMQSANDPTPAPAQGAKGAKPGKKPKAQIPIGPRPGRRPRLSAIQKVLIAGIFLLVAVLLYTQLMSPPRPPAQAALEADPGPQKTAVRPGDQAHKQIQQPLPPGPIGPGPSPGPASLKVAQDFFRQKEYNKAHDIYDRLCQSLPEKARMHRDFLELKMALCTLRAGWLEDADRALNDTAKSHSHVVALMANYHRISLDMQRKQYLNARKRAYLVIALIATVDIDTKLASALRSNCYFLIAEAMTRNVLSLSDDDADLPGKFWSNSTPEQGPGPSGPAGSGAGPEIDPFADLNNQQLDTLLKSGSDYLAEGLLSPQIRKIEHEDGSILWSVVCNGAPIEELLARFAANAALDVSWIFSAAQTPQEAQDIAHTRPVVLYLPVATQQQVIAAAAGQVGLLAHIRDDNVVSVYQPDKFSSLSQHISLLCNETISLWQRFLLTFQSDKRTANAHFALGLLHARRGDTPEAIAEYKLMANRFAFSSLAPYALLHSSKLKSGPQLRDYVGAKQDLEQLVSQYPDSDVTARANIYLAEYTARAGLKKEAARIYRKVYNLALSAQSQSTAAFGAAQCYYQISDYDSAAKWLTLHIDIATNRKSENVCSAYALLGKTYLALKDPEQACRAFRYALDGQLPRELYVETVSELIKGYVEQKKFIQALDALEDVDFWQFSQAESVRVLLIKSRILQDMGLIEKAITILGDRAEYISDPHLKAKMAFEVANCYIALTQLPVAHEELTKLLAVVQPGPLAYEIAIRLAETCSMLGLDHQVISVCTQFLDSDVPEQTRQKAAAILAMAYNRQQDYDSAALALLDKQK
ncbi:MAG: tetratricopeptide repeat protein [Phycisphaerae bacterium]|nr:tetratricopeptide repeat protein [Phycisphaerae bacterium]